MGSPADPAGSPAAALVIGYGNELRADDGIGPAVAERLCSDPRAIGTRVLAVRQLTQELALDVAKASLVVLVDATVGLEPGGIAVRDLASSEVADNGGTGDVSGLIAGRDESRDAIAGPFSHHVSPIALLGLASVLYGARPRAVIVSLGVASLAFGDGLSPAVEAALPGAVDTIISLVASHTAAGS